MSNRPIRTSARQSAIQEQVQKQREEEKRERRHHGRDHRVSHSSRSQSPFGNNSFATTFTSEEGHGPSRSLDHSSSSSHEDQNGQEHRGPRDIVPAEDATEPFLDEKLPTYWEIALVYGFLTKFKSLLRQTCPLHEFTMEDLEAGLLSTSRNTCIEEIHANLLSNMLNRKKAVDSHTWQKVLSETLDAKLKTREFDYENILRIHGSYYKVLPVDRVQILKALVDWVLQEGTVIRQGIEDFNEDFMIEPFGQDQSKRVYWYFGGGTLRVFRETVSKKKNVSWETVASNLEELRALADSFDKSTSKVEKALQERLRTEVIEPIEERAMQKEKKQERLEKRLQKLAELHQLASTRTTRTRSSNRINAPRYNFDDEEEDEEEEDEYAMYRRPSSRRRIEQERREQQVQGSESRQEQQQSSATPSAPVSARSSIDRDSDTSFSHAFQQRARVGDDQEDYQPGTGSASSASASPAPFAVRNRGSSVNGGLAHSEGGDDYHAKDGDYAFEEDLDDDEGQQQKQKLQQFIPQHFTPPASAPALVPVPEPAPAPAPAPALSSLTSAMDVDHL